jgi:phosphonopyruvate decarboxylase
VGYYQPKRFLHIVLDNESHDSTGGQHTSSPVVRFADVAAATNYRRAYAAERPDDVARAVRDLRAAEGPSLLHLRIKRGSPESLGRPTVKPHEVKDRFMAFLQSGSGGPLLGDAEANSAANTKR